MKIRLSSVFLSAALLCCSALAAVAAPPNDNFAQQQPLPGLEGQLNGTTVGATFEPNEPFSMFSERASVWYRWVAPVNGRARFSASGRSNSMTLAVYAGSGFGNFQRQRLLENLSETSTTFDAVASTPYYIQIATQPDSTTPFELSYYQQPAPANDDFARAITLAGSDGQIQLSILGATREAGETGLSLSDISVWYRIRPTVSGTARFAASGTEASTVTVYTGTSVSNLVKVSPFISTNPFEVTAGTIYAVRVSGLPRFGGTSSLSYSVPGTPTFSASGRVLNPASPGGVTGVYNAIVMVGPVRTATDGAGFFNVTGLPAGSYNVQAQASGYVLAPQFRNPVNLATNETGLLFKATPGTSQPPDNGSLLIAGRITDNAGRPLPGVTVASSSGARVTTNAAGQYQFAAAPGAIQIRPSKAGYEFYPTISLVALRRINAPNINFYGVPGS